MRLSDNGIEIRGWQFCLIIGVIAMLILAGTVTTIFQKSIELEKAKIAEAEATKRGHWLWGSKSENYREFERREANVITEDRVPSSIQRFNTETGLHPTQKPQKLFEYLIQTYTNEGDVVCDPFGGSGTTAAAAKNTGRRYVSIEAKADYVEIQRQRLAQGVLF